MNSADLDRGRKAVLDRIECDDPRWDAAKVRALLYVGDCIRYQAEMALPRTIDPRSQQS